MPPGTVRPPFDQLLATADAKAGGRPEVDVEMAREVFHEAPTLLDNGLVLDGLDEHDASAVVAGLCLDLVVADLGARSARVRRQRWRVPAILRDPEGVSAAYPTAAAIFRL